MFIKAIPDTTQYQYDETSGYYYDPSTGLYYDSNSQYYYNNEASVYLYWDAENSTYTLASTDAKSSATAGAAQSVADSASTTTESTSYSTIASSVPKNIEESTKKESFDEEPIKKEQYDDYKDVTYKKEPKHDKVKVAKKIVKDMEKWAKQLNQKKDMPVVQPPMPEREEPLKPLSMRSGYADVGFSILENKERVKVSLNMAGTSTALPPSVNKIIPSYGSDSDNEHNEPNDAGGPSNEKDYVDFEKLTCLLCKRAFQSLEILNKHLKMSNLHKENLQKYNLSKGSSGGEGKSNGNGSAASNLSYRDRAKERRLKYGESDPPPPNKSRERFEKEIQKQAAAMQAQTSTKLASVPIGENNVGNRLLQKMGWSEGQGLGRKNQGRTNIIEVCIF